MKKSGLVHHTLPLFPHTLPLILYGVPPMEEKPPKTSCTSPFSWATDVHKLMQHGTLTWGIVCSSVVPLQGQKSCQQICSSIGSSSWGPRSCHESSLVQTSHRLTEFRAHTHRVPLCVPPWTAGGFLLHGLVQMWQWNNNIPTCPGVSQGRIHFLPSNQKSAVFWGYYENNVDNTTMLLVVAQ